MIYFANHLFSQVENADDILFAGSILSYTAINVPPCRFVVEEFLLFSRIYGEYDENSDLQKDRNIHQYESITYLKSGLAQNIDLNLLITAVYAHANSSDALSLADTLFLFGFQLMRAQKDTWMPDVRFLVGESFPTGKFDELDLDNNGFDGTGSGAFETNFILSLCKIFPISDKHAFRLTPNFYYILSSSVPVQGYNVYGGGAGTKGTIKPGKQISADLGCEYNLTNHLILGLDIFYTHQDTDVFISKIENAPLAGLPSSENFSLTPCIEYNPTKNFGVEGGVWFTVAGRNSLAFTTCIFVAWWYF